jgi:hypothetical protein
LTKYRLTSKIRNFRHDVWFVVTSNIINFSEASKPRYWIIPTS